MAGQRIIVIGASAGGLESLLALFRGMPKDIAASFFVVLHLPSTAHSFLPEIMTRSCGFKAVHPKDGESIRRGIIYVAPPDNHLLVEKGRIVVKKGPKENRFRPSIDALFRSAAYIYGPDVIGIVLSGMLDDGTSGLWSIKRMGGVSIVQDPKNAPYDSMPLSALEHVDVDHVADAKDMGTLLEQIVSQPSGDIPKEADLGARMKMEVAIATSADAFDKGVMTLGELTPFTCPECHGVLVRLKEGLNLRFRCHTGHAYSANALLGGVMEMVDEYNWQHMRALEEAVMLMRHIGDHMKAGGNPASAALFFKHAEDSDRKAKALRKTTLEHENLSGDRIRATADD